MGLNRPGYKRFFLTLHEVRFEEFKKHLIDFGCPRNFAETIFDEYILAIITKAKPYLKVCKKAGKVPTVEDFYKFLDSDMRKEPRS